MLLTVILCDICPARILAHCPCLNHLHAATGTAAVAEVTRNAADRDDLLRISRVQVVTLRYSSGSASRESSLELGN